MGDSNDYLYSHRRSFNKINAWTRAYFFSLIVKEEIPQVQRYKKKLMTSIDYLSLSENTMSIYWLLSIQEKTLNFFLILNISQESIVYEFLYIFLIIFLPLLLQVLLEAYTDEYSVIVNYFVIVCSFLCLPIGLFKLTCYYWIENI